MKTIEQPKFTYCPLGKTFEKRNKKKLDALKALKPNRKK